jgi:hypothetical protein
MSDIRDEYEADRQFVEDLYELLQGNVPEDVTPSCPKEVPKLTKDQAWFVIWWLGNSYRQVPDHVERCDVCGAVYNSWSEGQTLDFGNAPYSFCGNCTNSRTPEYVRKVRIGRGLERSKKRVLTPPPLATT